MRLPMPARALHEPWRAFLRDLDRDKPTELHCFGGFVVSEYYGLTRATADIDILESRGTNVATIARLAGEGTPLHRRHNVYVDVVTIASVPDDYESRLIDFQVAGLRRLKLKVFERHDVVLAKLCRNIDKDREDVSAFATGPGLDTELMTTRYREELRPVLARPEREDLTLQLWVEMIHELAAR
jgi:hypothetical protein